MALYFVLVGYELNLRVDGVMSFQGFPGVASRVFQSILLKQLVLRPSQTEALIDKVG